MEKKINITFRAVADVGEYGIGVAASFNGIFKWNYEDCKIEYIGSVPGENSFGGSLYCEAILNGTEVIFIPFCAECIAVLDLKTMNISTCPLPNIQNKDMWKFTTVCRYKNKLYLIPGKYDYILSFDVITHEIEKIVEWKTLLSVDNCDMNNTLLAAGMIGVHENMAYIQVMYTNILLVFNMEKGIVENRVYLPEGSYTVATVYKENVWVVPSDSGSIVRVSVKDLSVEKFCNSPLRRENDAANVTVRIMCKNDKLYMLPQGAYRIGIVDLVERTSSINNTIIDELSKKYKEYPRFFFVKEFEGERLYVSMLYKKSDMYSNLIMSLEELTAEEFYFKGNDEWKNQYLDAYIEDNHYAVHTEKILKKILVFNPLERYIKYLKTTDEVEKQPQFEFVGKAIHDCIKGQ